MPKEYTPKTKLFISKQAKEHMPLNTQKQKQICKTYPLSHTAMPTLLSKLKLKTIQNGF